MKSVLTWCPMIFISLWALTLNGSSPEKCNRAFISVNANALLNLEMHGQLSLFLKGLRDHVFKSSTSEIFSKTVNEYKILHVTELINCIKDIADAGVYQLDSVRRAFSPNRVVPLAKKFSTDEYYEAPKTMKRVYRTMKEKTVEKFDQENEKIVITNKFLKEKGNEVPLNSVQISNEKFQDNFKVGKRRRIKSRLLDDFEYGEFKTLDSLEEEEAEKEIHYENCVPRQDSFPSLETRQIGKIFGHVSEDEEEGHISQEGGRTGSGS